MRVTNSYFLRNPLPVHRVNSRALHIVTSPFNRKARAPEMKSAPPQPPPPPPPGVAFAKPHNQSQGQFRSSAANLRSTVAANLNKKGDLQSDEKKGATPVSQKQNSQEQVNPSPVISTSSNSATPASSEAPPNPSEQVQSESINETQSRASSDTSSHSTNSNSTFIESHPVGSISNHSPAKKSVAGEPAGKHGLYSLGFWLKVAFVFAIGCGLAVYQFHAISSYGGTIFGPEEKGPYIATWKSSPPDSDELPSDEKHVKEN